MCIIIYHDILHTPIGYWSPSGYIILKKTPLQVHKVISGTLCIPLLIDSPFGVINQYKN